MNNRGIIRVIQRILQIATIICGVVAIVSMIDNYFYEKKLKIKAKAYLKKELGEVEECKRPIAIYSPKTKEQKARSKKFLFATVICGASLFLVNLFNKED